MTADTFARWRAITLAFLGCCVLSFLAGRAYVKHDPDNFTRDDCHQWITETVIDVSEVDAHQCDKRVKELGDIYESVCRRSVIP